MKLWWEYICPAMANIGVLKEAQSKLMALGVDYGDAGRILSGVQSFYIDAAYNAAKRYEDDNSLKNASAWRQTTNDVFKIIQKCAEEECDGDFNEAWKLCYTRFVWS